MINSRFNIRIRHNAQAEDIAQHPGRYRLGFCTVTGLTLPMWDMICRAAKRYQKNAGDLPEMRDLSKAIAKAKAGRGDEVTIQITHYSTVDRITTLASLAWYDEHKKLGNPEVTASLGEHFWLRLVLNLIDIEGDRDRRELYCSDDRIALSVLPNWQMRRRLINLKESIAFRQRMSDMFAEMGHERSYGGPTVTGMLTARWTMIQNGQTVTPHSRNNRHV